VNEALESVFTGFGLAQRDALALAPQGQATQGLEQRLHTDPLVRQKDPARDKYELEKLLGTRRTSGSLNLKRLKPKHLRIIDEHCLGRSNVDIATDLTLSQTYVSIVLTDPLVTEQIQIRVAENIAEMSALRHKAVHAVRTALGDGKTDATRLKAADMFFKVEGDYARASEHAAAETAEDVIQRMLQLNLQVNVNTDSRAERALDSTLLSAEE